MKTSLIPKTTGYESILIDGEISDPQAGKRVSRTKLLNGGQYINNEGWDIEDSTISILYELKSDSEFEKINDIYVNNIAVLIETQTDILECVISSFSYVQGIASLELWVRGIITVKSDIEYPPVPVMAEWVDVTSDIYWEGYGAGSSTFALLTWDGSKWSGTGSYTTGRSYSLDIAGSASNGYSYPWGSWADGFKPTKYRITYSYTNTAGYVVGFDIDTYANFDNLYSLAGIFPVSGQAYDIDWSNPEEGVPADHDALYEIKWEHGCQIFPIVCDSTMEITKIEFYGVKTW